MSAFDRARELAPVLALCKEQGVATLEITKGGSIKVAFFPHAMLGNPPLPVDPDVAPAREPSVEEVQAKLHLGGGRE